MAVRKYDTEMRVSIVVHPHVLGRQRDLRNIDISIVQDCHLYIVSRRPRLSVHPSSVKQAGPGRTLFTIRSQVAADFVEYPSEIFSKKFTQPLEWAAEWPYEDFTLVLDGSVVMTGPVGQLPHHMQGGPDELRDHEILYVGQAFGKDGERNAWDRLKSHSTLQEIYSENKPDHDIWLTLCEIPEVVLLQDMDPGPADVTGEDDIKHVLEVMRRADSPQFYKREALTMAEAGLIRFFMPAYNEKFKRNYPDPNHVHISTAYDLDLSDLFIELHDFAIHARFWSTMQPERPKLYHTAHFPLRATGGLISLVIPATSQRAPRDQ